MSPDTVDIHAAAAAFLGGLVHHRLHLSAFGVHPEMLPPAFRAAGYAHDASIATDLPPIWPENTPADLHQVPPADAEVLPALAAAIAESWSRSQVTYYVAMLQTGLRAVEQEAGNPEVYTSGSALAQRAMGCITETHAVLRHLLAPGAVLATKPPEELAQLVFVTTAEVRLLAGALEMMADGLFEEHRDADAFRLRASQLRNLVDPPPAEPVSLAVPSSGALH